MTTDKEDLLKDARERAEKDVLLEEILRLERRVGLIDGEKKGRENIMRTWSTIALIVIAILGLVGWTYINTRIDSAVTSSINDVLEQKVKERMESVEFTGFLDEKIKNVASEVIVEAEKAVDDAEQALDNAEKAVIEANQAKIEAEGAAADAKDASEVAEEVSDVVEALATQTSDEAP